MLFTSITYSRTKNLGDYQSERLELSADIEPGDNPAEVFAALKERVEIELGIRPSLVDSQAEDNPF